MKGSTFLTILVAIAAVAVLGLGIFAVITATTPQQPEFVPPPFAEEAQEGVPTDLDSKYSYMTIFQPGMAYSTSLCGAPALEDGALTLYLTNIKENNVWLKVRIFDKSGNVVAESGLIKPGQYLKSIPLNEGVALENGDALTLKLMGYEPETYYSGGSFTINTFVGGLPDPNDTAMTTPSPTASAETTEAATAPEVTESPTLAVSDSTEE